MMGWITKIFYLFINAVLVLASFFFRIPQGKFSDDTVNIVLVHGFLVNKEILFFLKRKLERLGFNVVLPELGWGTRDITHYAKELVAFLKRGMKGKIILVGSSLGGIIVLEAQRLDSEIARLPVVTLGAPVKGTPLAWLILWCRSGRQMLPGSEFVGRLNSFLENRSQQLVMVRARFDELIPKEQSCHKSAICKEVNVVGHGGLIFFIKEDDLRSIFYPLLNG